VFRRANLANIDSTIQARKRICGITLKVPNAYFKLFVIMRFPAATSPVKVLRAQGVESLEVLTRCETGSVTQGCEF